MSDRHLESVHRNDRGDQRGTVTVPPGAKTGVIAVESPLGSARSKAKFTVRK